MLRILIVEDEALIAMDLRDIFEDEGHTVIGIAATTAEAISIASTSMPFDLAVLDIDLARGDDGVETANRLRNEFEVEALFVSGRLEEEVRVRSLGWEPVDFIGKPYLQRQVLKAIGQIETK